MANGQNERVLDNENPSAPSGSSRGKNLAELETLIEAQVEQTEALYAILQMQVESLNRMADTYRKELDACKTADSLNRFVETCRQEVANYRREFEAWKKDSLVFQEEMAKLKELRQQYKFKKELLSRYKGDALNDA